MLRRALDVWRALPASERRPGAIQIEDLTADPRFTRTPPPGGLILRSFTRALEGDAPDRLRAARIETYGAQAGPQHDHVWLTKSEWQALVPPNVHMDMQFPVPEPVMLRIFRYHLVDGTVGEPTFWSREQVRSGTMTLTVESVTASRVRLRLDGHALLATAAEGSDRGYDVRLLGYLDYRPLEQAFERFDVVAQGDAWGGNPVYSAAEGRIGRRPLGVAFELASGELPSDRVPPQGARVDDYWAAGAAPVGAVATFWKAAAGFLLLIALLSPRWRRGRAPRTVRDHSAGSC